jgi:TPR repeat protein
MVSNMQGRSLILLLGLGMAVTGSGQAASPDRAKLKAAAEAGDSHAQYEYAKALPSSDAAGQLAWYFRSARAGYAPAQEALGSHFASEASVAKVERLTRLRESVRWSSRAAFAGIYTAQLRIAQFYRKGEVLPKDLVAAYLWMQTAINHSPLGIIYKSSLDQLTAEMLPAERAEAEGKLNKFRLAPVAGLNPVEADLILAQLHLGGTSVANGVPQVVINDVRFASGETKELKLEGESVRLVCFSIDENSALVSIAGTSYIHWLKR